MSRKIASDAYHRLESDRLEAFKGEKNQNSGTFSHKKIALQKVRFKGLLAKDFLTFKKKIWNNPSHCRSCYHGGHEDMLEDKGALFISFLLLPLEIMSIVITLATCDEQWKWSKYAISLPVSKTQIVSSRYEFALLMSAVGLVVALIEFDFLLLFPQVFLSALQ